jgi:hypothetical protein
MRRGAAAPRGVVAPGGLAPVLAARELLSRWRAFTWLRSLGAALPAFPIRRIPRPRLDEVRVTGCQIRFLYV